MRKVLTIVALLCVLAVAGVQAANQAGNKQAAASSKPAPAAKTDDALYPCTQDCNTREGGYRWAEHYAIANATDCKGKSVAFVDGCKDYVAEVDRPGDRRTRADGRERYGDTRYGENRYGDDRSENDRYRDDRDDRYRDDRYGDDRYGDERDDDGYDDNDNGYDDDDGYDDGDDDDDDDDDAGAGRYSA
jgi:hypothetical protein